MKKLLLSITKTFAVSFTGAAATLFLLLLVLNGLISFDMNQTDLSIFYHYVLMAHTAILWTLTTLLSLGSHWLKNDNMRIPLFWSCAYLPITYGLIRVVLELT